MALQNTFSDEEVQQKIDSLPADIQQLLYSSEMNTAIQQIGAARHLHVDQIGLLSALASNVMLGLTNTRDFVQAITEYLEVNETEAAAIAEDVNTQLFEKIRESLKQITTPATDVTATMVPPAASASYTPLPTQPTIAAPSMPSLEAHPLDAALSQPTVSLPQIVESGVIPTAATPVAPTSSAPAAPTKTYTVDPYREPVE